MRKGETTRIAEKMSMRQPTTIRKRLRRRRKTNFECTQGLDPGREGGGHVGVDEVEGEAPRGGDDHEGAADYREGLAEGGDELPRPELALDEGFDDGDVEDREGAYLAQAGEAGEVEDYRRDGDEELEGGGLDGAERGARAEWLDAAGVSGERSRASATGRCRRRTSRR